MPILKSLAMRTAATFATPLSRVHHAPGPVLRIKGLSAASIVFPPPEATKEVEMSFAGTMVRPAPTRGAVAAATANAKVADVQE